MLNWRYVILSIGLHKFRFYGLEIPMQPLRHQSFLDGTNTALAIIFSFGGKCDDLLADPPGVQEMS